MRAGAVVVAVRAVGVPLVLVALIGASGVALGRIYADPLASRLVIGAAVASVGISAAARRLPSWLVAPLSVAALAGYTGMALHLTARRAHLPGPLVDAAAEAVRNAIPRLLTAMIPVEPLPETVVVPVVAAWAAGLAAAEFALRAGRLLLSYLPPALLYAGVLYVVGPNADATAWPVLGFAGAAALGLVLSGGPTGAPSDAPGLPAAFRAAVRMRTLAGTAAAVAVVVALTAAVAPGVAARVGRAPVDPRRYVQPPQMDTLDENPLIRISGWALDPRQKLFDVRTLIGPGSAGARASAVPPIRLAVHSDYDGITWRVGATYRSAGRVLPPAAPAPGAAVDTVRQEITVAGLSGRLLPAVPTPQQVSGARVAYDPDSGTLIRPEGLTPGLRYAITSAREHPDVNLLPAADVPAGDAVARLLRVGAGVPEQLQRLAEQLAADSGAPYDRALALEDFLAEHYRLVADSPSGHAYPNLRFFLFGPRTAGGQRGTSEQFAAAYAVLGRLMALPTRVVVGFHNTGTGPVRAADAYAWPEVLFQDVGWVAFDPLPRPDTEPRPVEEDVRPEPDEPTPPPTPEPPPTAGPTPSAGPAAAATGPREGEGTTFPVLAGGGLGALLAVSAGYAVTVAVLRARQRRRRLDDGPPPTRVAGAWREVVDALRLAGRPAPGHLTATEVAAHARAAPSAPAIDNLAALVNKATFAPGSTDEAQARMARAEAVAFASALRAARPWLRRVVWSLHAGPLRWR